MSFGFVIVRHVNSEQTNEYWKECYTCIRNHYEGPILIVDDNSDPEFLKEDIELVNCQSVKSEFPRAGEILGYYYFHLLKPFDKALIMHDSVFIKRKIDFEQVQDCAFVWTFTHQWDDDESEIEIINKLDNHEEIIEMHKNKNAWSGCFGVMSVISWNFLYKINTRYNLFSVLLESIRDRENRMHLERVFACICASSSESRIPSILGSIHQYCQWGRTFANYKRGENSHLPVIKVWTGR
jgi:hypothetical protein